MTDAEVVKHILDAVEKACPEVERHGIIWDNGKKYRMEMDGTMEEMVDDIPVIETEAN